jgi:hypothetical protein
MKVQPQFKAEQISFQKNCLKEKKLREEGKCHQVWKRGTEKERRRAKGHLYSSQKKKEHAT